MKKIVPIHLTSSDLVKLKKHEIGHGTDGFVFRFGKNELIKLYHISLELLENMNFILEKETKIYNKKDLNIQPKKEIITYYQYIDEDIKQRSKDAIIKAISRQENIKKTKLPKNVVYVDGKFAGCVYDKAHGIQIHKLIGLPLEAKKAIILDVIESLKELHDNYIYHIDLDNSPFAEDAIFNNKGITEKVGHSHVLVDLLKKQTNIIDLDGKSTIYTEHPSEKYMYQSIYKFSTLLREFLFDINEFEIESPEDLEYYLLKTGIEDKYITPLASSSMTLEEIETFVKSLKKVNRL